MLWEVRPALKTEQFLKMMWGLADARQTDGDGLPRLLQFAVLFRAYNQEFRLLEPAWHLQCILFGFLAMIGRFRGYWSSYPDLNTLQEPGGLP